MLSPAPSASKEAGIGPRSVMTSRGEFGSHVDPGLRLAYQNVISWEGILNVSK